MFGWHAIFLVSGDVRFARLFCGLVELFGGPCSYWVTTRVFLFRVLVIIMDTNARKLVYPISLG